MDGSDRSGRHPGERPQLSALASPCLRLAAFAALAIVSILGRANAAVPPDNVQAALAEAAQACTQLTGTPNTEAVLTVDDLNGDGGEDWIVDFRGMKCEGATNPLCGNGGCTLQIYFWDGDVAWDIVFEDIVKSYKFSKSGGKRLLHVTTPGLPCNKPAEQTCTYTYKLEKDAVVPVE
jgi:hypothetical protein